MTRAISPLIIVALISLASAAKGSSSHSDFRKEISAAIQARARHTALKYGPQEFTQHHEKDADECSPHCAQKAADGRCDVECLTPGCLYDGGDCPSRPFLPCHELSCPAHGCNSACELAGCGSECDLQGAHTEFLHVFSPFLTPKEIYENFPTMEEEIREQTGISFKLAMIYGLHEGRPEPFAYLWPIYPKRRDYSQSLALFRVSDGFFSPKDKHALRTIERLGGSHFVAQVSPILLGTAQEELFAPFAASYEQERKKQMKKLQKVVLEIDD